MLHKYIYIYIYILFSTRDTFDDLFGYLFDPVVSFTSTIQFNLKIHLNPTLQLYRMAPPQGLSAPRLQRALS